MQKSDELKKRIAEYKAKNPNPARVEEISPQLKLRIQAHQQGTTECPHCHCIDTPKKSEFCAVCGINFATGKPAVKAQKTPPQVHHSIAQGTTTKLTRHATK